MALEKTLTIIKPDAMGKRLAGRILAILEESGFKILAKRKTRLTEAQARAFYAEHKDKPFYGSLVAYITSGPVIVAALRKEDAVKELRTLMGATNPAEAAEGTIRKLYGESIERNAIHGSANLDDARREVAFFFGPADLL
jgi:nucleoside-diphosphate kinase